MATRLPTGLYSGEAAVFNTQPYVQFYAQHMAQKQAKDEALDNYFRDQFKNLTPAGMRSQDIEGLTKKTAELQDFYQRNKEAIKNPRLDNGKAISEYQSRHQDALGYIQQSKNRVDKTKQLDEIRRNPEFSDRINQDTIHGIELHDLPINDPRSKEFDFSSLSYAPKPFDAKSQESFNKAITIGLTPSKKLIGTENLPGYQLKQTFGNQYSPEDLKVIGERAGSFYTSDKSIKHYADNDLLKSTLNDPNKYNELNDVYKKVYGKDAHSPEELFKAQAILNNSRSGLTENVVQDVASREKALQAIRTADAEKLMRLRKDINPNDTELNNQWVDSYIENRLDEAKNTEPGAYKLSKTGQTLLEPDIPLDPVISKALAKKGVEPSYLRVTRDGRFRPVYLQHDEKGNPIGKEGKFAVDAELSQPISREQLRLALGYKGVTKKELGKEVLNKSKVGKETPQSAATKAEELLNKYLK